MIASIVLFMKIGGIPVTNIEQNSTPALLREYLGAIEFSSISIYANTNTTMRRVKHVVVMTRTFLPQVQEAYTNGVIVKMVASKKIKIRKLVDGTHEKQMQFDNLRICNVFPWNTRMSKPSSLIHPFAMPICQSSKSAIPSESTASSLSSMPVEEPEIGPCTGIAFSCSCCLVG